MIPYGRQSIDEDDIRAVVDVLRSDWLTTGPAVEQFEQALAEVVGADGTVAVCNGTAALHSAMLACQLGPGDEVIVPAITFCATANAVLYAGARPVFADIDQDTLLIDPDVVARLVTDRTRAIVAVDFAGQPADYRALRRICDRHGLILIADACHSLGGSQDGLPVGSLADLTCFSFHPVKPITSGEGGAIAVRSDDDSVSREWLTALRAIRNHGIDCDHRARQRSGRHEYDMGRLGFNYRLTDIQAALACSQLKRLSRFRTQRTSIADRYARQLESVEGVVPLRTRPGVQHAWHLYVVRTEANIRDELFAHLRSRGIMANVHYRPVYEHSYYRQSEIEADCPRAERAAAEVISLPMFADLSDQDLTFVIDSINHFFECRRRAA